MSSHSSCSKACTRYSHICRQKRLFSQCLLGPFLKQAALGQNPPGAGKKPSASTAPSCCLLNASLLSQHEMGNNPKPLAALCLCCAALEHWQQPIIFLNQHCCDGAGGTHLSHREASAQMTAAFLLLPWGLCLSPGPSPSRPGSEPSRPAGHRRRDACDTGTCQPGKMKGVTREACRLLSAQRLPGTSTAFTLQNDSPTCTGEASFISAIRENAGTS